MIDLNFNTATGAVTLAGAAPIKPGGGVLARVIFSTAPGSLADLQLALASDATPPELLAFVDEWAVVNETTRTAVLDAADTRLVTYMSGKAEATLKAEFAATVNGVRQIGANLAVTVQHALVTGPATSEGGPIYSTTAQVAAAIAAAVGVTKQGALAIPNGQSYVDLAFGSPFATAAWIFTGLVVRNAVDGSPQNILPGIVTAKTAGGARVQLTAAVPTANYTLEYACKLAS